MVANCYGMLLFSHTHTFLSLFCFFSFAYVVVFIDVTYVSKNIGQNQKRISHSEDEKKVLLAKVNSHRDGSIFLFVVVVAFIIVSADPLICCCMARCLEETSSPVFITMAQCNF